MSSANSYATSPAGSTDSLSRSGTSLAGSVRSITDHSVGKPIYGSLTHCGTVGRSQAGRLCKEPGHSNTQYLDDGFGAWTRVCSVAPSCPTNGSNSEPAASPQRGGSEASQNSKPPAPQPDETGTASKNG